MSMGARAEWRFVGRQDAGRELARRVWARLWGDPGRENALVLGASPGGLMVAAPVAAGVQARLDAVAVCPIAIPDRFAHSLGAVTPTGPPVLARRSVARTDLPAAAIGSAVAAARQRARARELELRGYVPLPAIAGRTVIVVDDGLGIGVNALAVLRHVLRHHPGRLLFATPVCTKARARALGVLADEVISVVAPTDTLMAGSLYADLAPVSEAEIRAVLSARHPAVPKARPARSAVKTA